LPQQPVASSPEEEQGRENSEKDGQPKTESPQTHAPPFAGSQFDIEHMVALKPSVPRFASGEGQEFVSVTSMGLLLSFGRRSLKIFVVNLCRTSLVIDKGGSTKMANKVLLNQG
jgi:hypothetical protein